VFLVYRLPREPSAPRIALWRSLRRLGALLLSDGLVALPHSSRNREHLEWLAASIWDSHGTASVWVAQPGSTGTHQEYAKQLNIAVDAEYGAVEREARAATRLEPIERRRVLRRLRDQLRRIASRDYFGASGGADARNAIDELAREEVMA
jgi:hypothetical protein